MAGQLWSIPTEGGCTANIIPNTNSTTFLLMYIYV
jgi:hypothetical protein